MRSLRAGDDELLAPRWNTRSVRLRAAGLYAACAGVERGGVDAPAALTFDTSLMLKCETVFSADVAAAAGAGSNTSLLLERLSSFTRSKACDVVRSRASPDVTSLGRAPPACGECAVAFAGSWGRTSSVTCCGLFTSDDVIATGFIVRSESLRSAALMIGGLSGSDDIDDVIESDG